jgi:transcriptional regulator with GAF, ATPase, and Fis domain
MSAFPQRPKELEILVEATKTLTGRQPFQEKFASVLELLGQITESDFVTLRELDTETGALNLVASYRSDPQFENIRIPFSLVSNMLPMAIERNAPVVIVDYEAFESHIHEYAEWGKESALMVPVHVDGEFFRGIGFGSQSLDHYQEEMVQTATAIAAVVGMMMVKAELQETYEFEANIGRIVSAPLVGPDVFAQFATQAAKIIDFDRFVLTSVDVQNETFVTEFLFGDAAEGFPVREIISIEGTAQERVIRSRSCQRGALDEMADGKPRYPNSNFFVESGQRYFLGVPLIVGD